MTYRLLPDRRRAPRLALVGACVFAVGVVWALVVGSMKSSFDSAERGMSKWFYDVGTHEPIHSIMYWVSWIGAGARTVPIVLTVAVALLLFGKWRWTLFLLLSSQAGFFISNTIKHVVGRTRPPWTSLSADQIGTSFPSGHTYAVLGAWFLASGWLLLCWSAFLWFWAPRAADDGDRAPPSATSLDAPPGESP